MTLMKNRAIFALLALLAVLSLILAACGLLAPAATPTAVPPTPVPATTTPEPTATPTPLPDRVVLVAAPEADVALLEALRPVVQELAGSAGLEVDERPGLQPNEISAGMKVVILPAAPANLNELLAAGSQTQFAVFSSTALESAVNLSVVHYAAENQAFIAGYLATLIAGDWRSAGLLPNDGLLGGRLPEAFENGGQYYCGICSPQNGPYVRFPLSAGLPASASPAEWQAAVQTLQPSVIYVYYVAPEAASPELLTLLSQQEVLLLGGKTPADAFRPRWAGTVKLDAAAPLREIWPALIEGKGGQSTAAALQITDVQPGLLSPGRQSNAEQVYQKLAEGLINPLDIPLQ